MTLEEEMDEYIKQDDGRKWPSTPWYLILQQIKEKADKFNPPAA